MPDQPRPRMSDIRPPQSRRTKAPAAPTPVKAKPVAVAKPTVQPATPSPTQALRPKPVKRRRWPMVLAFVMIILVLAAAGVVWYLLYYHTF